MDCTLILARFLHNFNNSDEGKSTHSMIVFQYTALHTAAMKGSYDVVLVLIREGADLDSRDKVRTRQKKTRVCLNSVNIVMYRAICPLAALGDMATEYFY